MTTNQALSYPNKRGSGNPYPKRGMIKSSIITGLISTLRGGVRREKGGEEGGNYGGTSPSPSPAAGGGSSPIKGD